MSSSSVKRASFPKSCEAPAALAVELRGVTKRFHHYEERSRSLRELFVRMVMRRPPNVRHAMFRVTGLELSVAAGESVALIGANGSGKSTALRLIAGIYPPSEGSIQVHGRAAAVIELGAGFHPDLTGMENIGLYASMMGLDRGTIAAREPEIIAFAELGDFIDVPIRYYSSGMQARLAFAVAVCVEPDILLLDEVLSVGDEGFRERCMDRLRAFHARGGTLIVVSHDLATVREFCSRAVWMERGAVRMTGDVDEVVDAYLAEVAQ
jgi:lipopolysaccharide transport system ATP-binding protein